MGRHAKHMMQAFSLNIPPLEIKTANDCFAFFFLYVVDYTDLAVELNFYFDP